MQAANIGDGAAVILAAAAAKGEAVPKHALAQRGPAAHLKKSAGGSLLGGAKLCRRDGSDAGTLEAAAGGKLVALYFSAHWCPPCQRFTPMLTRFYNEVRAPPCSFHPIRKTGVAHAAALRAARVGCR